MEQKNSYTQPWVLVRGAGDLASGTILRLHRCGFKVIATECADPSAIRRKAAFCTAVWDREATIEGVTCCCVSDAKEAEAVRMQGAIPLLIDADCRCVPLLRPAVVVDAILAKRNLGTNHNLAPITVGLGPGFVAGTEVDCVVETMRGHHLGRVIYQGTAIADTGIPGNIGGYTHQRVIHSPSQGSMVFASDEAGNKVDIGSMVTKGQIIGLVDEVPVYATLDGVLRGLIREGYPVQKGLKIADIDPRPEQAAYCDTVSDKARAIAGGVVEGILSLASMKGIRLL